MLTEILCGDNLPILREMPDNSVDAIVTDPPYGLSFMGKRWDYDVPSVELWVECLRVLKPGGHLLAFAGTRTQHRMAVRIEDVGFEIRDMIAWVYGSGFPKSLDVSKAIDREAGAEREVVGKYRAAVQSGVTGGLNGSKADSDGVTWATITAPATDAAKQWNGWGTALKPALEPITLARKPLAERTVAANVLEWGTGGVNVDGCRVGTDDTRCKHNKAGIWSDHNNTRVNGSASGRFPANLIHDGSDDVVRLFPQSTSGANPTRRGGMGYHGAEGQESCDAPRGAESGSAARFFYCAKAGKGERDAGLEKLEAVHRSNGNKWTDIDYRVVRGERPPSAESGPRRNVHPTVKPIALMRYLCRLVTPPGGIVLDPFTGSGTTGCAAMLEGFDFIGIEREAEYAEIARRRIEHWRDVASQDEAIIEDVQEKLFAEMI